jgi:hypothetical protein
VSIREYIDLVEQNLREWPFRKKEPDISKRVFGREPPKEALPTAPTRQLDIPKPTHGMPDTSPELETARTFRTADAYAYSSANQYMPLRTYSTAQAKRAAEEEANRLRSKWNFWKKQGYIQ